MCLEEKIICTSSQGREIASRGAEAVTGGVL